MYYIDAVESEMVLFDFPEIAPATESSSDGESIGSKFVKVVKFIAKKIKEFIQKIIELIKKLLGLKNKYKALDIKNQALREFRARIKAYLPDKDVTDLTKIKGLSSYTGGESGPYISEAQAKSAEQAVEQSLDYIIDKYNDELKIYESDLAIINEYVNKGYSKLAYFVKNARSAANSNNYNDAYYELKNSMNAIHEASEKTKTAKNDAISTRDTHKKKTLEALTNIVNGKSNGTPDDISNLIKATINRYASGIKTSLRDANTTLSSHLKDLEKEAEYLNKMADEYKDLADSLQNIPNSEPWKNVSMDGSKAMLEFSKNIFAATNTIKASSEGTIFEGVEMPPKGNG